MSLSYVHGASAEPLLGVTIGAAFAARAGESSHREALVSCHQGLRFTWGELYALCRRVARGLIAAGVRKGDRLGIWSPNHAEWVVVQFAAAQAGAILVNINPAYRTGEAEYALRQSGCSALVLAPPFKTSDYAGMIGQLRPELPDLRTVVTFGDQRLHGACPWEELLALGDSVPEAELDRRLEEQHADEPINIQYTSGTTGFPKGATLSHHSILNNAHFIAGRMEVTEADRVCIPVPFYHCFGMVIGNLLCLTRGATMVVPAPVFDAGATLRAIHEERCTVVHGVPTMFLAELEHPDLDRYDLSCLRTGVMAGSPCPVSVMRRVAERMNLERVTIAYGMTETSPVSFQTRPGDPERKRCETVGRVHPHVECKIVDPATGRAVPRGQPGELLSRGYLVMLGYWNDPEATARAIDAARWMHSGDQAVMDEEGFVTITGRLKDLIIRGGENIAPREIEECLYGHPAVQDVQAIGVPDERYGEEVMVWVRLRPGQSVAAEELQSYCRQRLAHFKVPRYVKFVGEFPMTVTGKIQKFRMREIAVRELAEAGGQQSAHCEESA